MLRAPRRIGPIPKPLDARELDRIWRWERLMIAYYVTATATLIVCLAAVLLVPMSGWLLNLVLVVLVATIAVGGAIQFRERCPRCRTLLGRQARFVLPELCKSCGVEFPRVPAGGPGAPRGPGDPRPDHVRS